MNVLTLIKAFVIRTAAPFMGFIFAKNIVYIPGVSKTRARNSTPMLL